MSICDWSKINNDKSFQNLVNHLFFLECPSTYGFVPFSPYIGKDGGWDGKYEGYYPKEKLQGLYCIQAKYTKHNFNAAMNSLSEWAKEELEKARKNNVDHLRLATTAQLRDEHIAKIEKLNKKQVRTFKIWHGQDLINRIELEPFLRLYYFGSPAIPLFVPSSIYFCEVEKTLQDVKMAICIKSIDDRLNEVTSFVNDNSKRIFVLHAFGGFGKTHFLKMLAGKIAELRIDREVWFIRDGVRDIKDAIQDEIGARDSEHRKHKYIFVLDDADRWGDTKDILNCVRQSGVDIKVVLALRTSGLSYTEEIIDSIRCREVTDYKSIPEWTKDELKALLRAAAQKDKIDHEDEIIAKYPNPWFITHIGLNMKGLKEFDLNTFMQSIIQSLLNDARKIFPKEKGDVGNLLFHLSMITPLNINDKQTINKLSRITDISERVLEKTLDSFTKNGVLKEIGGNLRFIPDMIGDVYLLEKMKNATEEERKKSFLSWFDTHSKKIFCNLGATLHYGESDWLVTIVKDVISGWIRNAAKDGGYDKKQQLENLREICRIAPDEAIDLLYAYLDTPELSTDDFGPVVIRLIHSKCERQKIVDIMEKMRSKVKIGTYDNYKPNSLAREAVSPLRNSIEMKILPIFDIIENSLTRQNPLVEFSKNALQEVLASAHEWSSSTNKAVTYGSRILVANDIVRKMRDKAIVIVKKMLLDKLLEVRLAAIDVIGAIGENHFGPGSIANDFPLSAKIDEERRGILEFIDANSCIQKETDYQILSAYEDLIFSWWGLQKVPDEISLKLLGMFQYTPEYRIYRYYSSRYDISGDVMSKTKQAPLKERWTWVVHNMLKKWDLQVADFNIVANDLNEKYNSAEYIVAFLESFGRRVQSISSDALFLRAWFIQNPEVFKEIRNNSEQWARIPLAFRYTLTNELFAKYPDMAEIIVQEVLLSGKLSIEEAKIALDVLRYDIPAIDKTEIVKTVAEKENDELNLAMLANLHSISNKLSVSSMGEMVSNILNHLSMQSKSRAIDSVAFILHGKDNQYKSEFFSITSDTICQTLLDINELDYHDFEVAAMLFKDVNEWMNFIETRIEQEKARGYSDYKAIPYRKIEFLSSYINTPESFLIAIKRAIVWTEKYKDVFSLVMSKVFEQIVTLRDQAGTMYFETQGEKLLNNKSDFEVYLKCLSWVPLTKAYLYMFKAAINISTIWKYGNEMAELLRNKVAPEDGWSSSPGQTPPAFIEKKECFEELKNIVHAGVLRNVLESCIRGVDSMIKQHLQEEENRAHSR